MEARPHMATVKIVGNTLILDEKEIPIKDEWVLISTHNPLTREWNIKTIDFEAVKLWLDTTIY